MTINIGSMAINEKQYGTNYDLGSLKGHFLLNNRNMVEFWTTTMSDLTNKYEYDEDVTASE